MIEGHFVPLRLPMTAADFGRLPRHPAYRYEHFDETAWLTPQPLWYHAELDLESFHTPQDALLENHVLLRPLDNADWAALPAAFAASFHDSPPFASMNETRRLEAAGECLDVTRLGGDGPVLEPACFVAIDDKERLCGAAIVTLIRNVDLTDFSSEMRIVDPNECATSRPHLTWVFVRPLSAGHGIGTSLLAASVRALLNLCYQDLASTFLLGNDRSALWHWRNGFRLLGHPQSWRELRKRWLA